ncbi:MAG TPA: hypothetical protein VF657_03860 [Actinoplanes sp.]
MSRARWSRIRAGLRQRRHHPAFRIPPPAWQPDQRDRLRRLLTELDAVVASVPGREPPLDTKGLALAATNLWRGQQRLARDPHDDTALVRQSGRYLRMCRDALLDVGLEIRDHDGEAFHSGRSLEVLAFEDDPAVSAETVIDTVRPSVLLHGQRIQVGQVIVGCPVKTDDTQGGDHA